MKTTPLFSHSRSSFHSSINESNSSKLRALNDKMDVLETQESRLSLKRQAFFSQSIQVLEGEISKSYDEGQASFQRLEDSLLSINEEFTKDKRVFGMRTENEMGVIRGLEGDLLERIEENSQDYRKRFEEVNDEIRGKIEGLISRASNKSEEKSLEFADRTRETIEVFSGLEKRLTENREDREKNEVFMMTELKERISETGEIIERESKIREETEGKIMKMIVEIREGLESAIKEEREVRTANQEILVRLLEESCNKIDKGLY